ncbi:MAG TPA: helix-turn-helix domain-containing protein [Bryobacteraceae bacterium]|jgi:hypothetical protein|nr:helix-turn-helix domain-containing protein [Bryobacteraceae bacterium]
MDQPPSKPPPSLSDVTQEIQQRIEEDHAAAYAQFVAEILKFADRREPLFRYLSHTFEIYAHHRSFLKFKEGLKGWEDYLTTLREWVLGQAETLTAPWDWPLGVPFLEQLRAHLIGRSYHWKAEVMKREREAKAANQSPHPAIIAAPSPSPKAPKGRDIPDPKPELLRNPDATLSRLKAAEALGIATRTLDRWVADRKLTPIGFGARKRFKVKDLQRLLDQKLADKRDTQ